MLRGRLQLLKELGAGQVDAVAKDLVAEVNIEGNDRDAGASLLRRGEVRSGIRNDSDHAPSIRALPSN